MIYQCYFCNVVCKISVQKLSEHSLSYGSINNVSNFSVYRPFQQRLKTLLRDHLLFLDLIRPTWPCQVIKPIKRQCSSLFLLVESSSEISGVIAQWNSVFVPCCFDFSWTCKWNLVISCTVCWQIWYPKNSKMPKISNLKLLFKKPYLSQYLMDFNK